MLKIASQRVEATRCGAQGARVCSFLQVSRHQIRPHPPSRMSTQAGQSTRLALRRPAPLDRQRRAASQQHAEQDHRPLGHCWDRSRG